MFRVLGFLIGSVTALIIILIILGIPEFHLADTDGDQQRFDAAVKKLKERQRAAVENASVPAGDESGESETDVSEDGKAVTEQVLQADAEQLDTLSDVSPHAVTPADAPEIPPAHPTDQEETQWYSFWNPFRSEIAARGFVSQLEEVTGLDYRVVKVKTGVYEVAFAYGNDTERRTKLSQISAATGLELPDS